MKYFRTYSMPGDSGPSQATHIEGIGDSYTLCGVDTAGDTSIHRKPPELLPGKARVTCAHCKQIIELVREHLGL